MKKLATKSNKFNRKYVPLLKFKDGYKVDPLVKSTKKAIRIKIRLTPKEGLRRNRKKVKKILKLVRPKTVL